MKNIDELILKGNYRWMRPVLLTAAAAALGFYQWLIFICRTEVAEPLATVVIGGLFTATILTMVVLYYLKVLTRKSLKRQNLKTS
jgi:cobalt-zinc-cadmium resistance protein CzcA